MTLEIISYSLETTKAFISNLCSLTREQAGNFACHFPAVIYAPAETVCPSNQAEPYKY